MVFDAHRSHDVYVKVEPRMSLAGVLGEVLGGQAQGIDAIAFQRTNISQVEQNQIWKQSNFLPIDRRIISCPCDACA